MQDVSACHPPIHHYVAICLADPKSAHQSMAERARAFEPLEVVQIAD